MQNTSSSTRCGKKRGQQYSYGKHEAVGEIPSENELPFSFQLQAADSASCIRFGLRWTPQPTVPRLRRRRGAEPVWFIRKQHMSGDCVKKTGWIYYELAGVSSFLFVPRFGWFTAPQRPPSCRRERRKQGNEAAVLCDGLYAWPQLWGERHPKSLPIVTSSSPSEASVLLAWLIVTVAKSLGRIKRICCLQRSDCATSGC